ncbi:hypothetical protein TNCV_731121 [Trichonephila clavipes]|nr:hypothetical protein TNCV_731121 [Trichonephila clavipes]
MGLNSIITENPQYRGEDALSPHVSVVWKFRAWGCYSGVDHVIRTLFKLTVSNNTFQVQCKSTNDTMRLLGNNENARNISKSLMGHTNQFGTVTQETRFSEGCIHASVIRSPAIRCFESRNTRIT